MADSQDRMKKVWDILKKRRYISPSKRRMSGDIETLRRGLLQAYTQIDILSATSISTEDVDGNQYTDKATTVDEIYSKYQNKSTWGCQFMQRIVNQRKSIVMPYGVKPQKSALSVSQNKNTSREMEFIQRFLDFNNFQEGREDDFCKYAEMEGQMCTTLAWDENGDGDGGLPRVRRFSWYKNKYDISVDDDDPDVLVGISYKDTNGDEKDLNISADYVAYVAFNEVDLVGMPSAAYVINECENLHKALVGWRKTNMFFAKLTPFFGAETWDEAQSIINYINANGWTLGKGFAGRDMKLVGPTSAVSEMYYDEIKTNAQVISGGTGIPIHYLGFADVLSNRSTAETLTEPMAVIALTDMVKWRGYYETLFDLAIKMRNAKLNSTEKAKLNPGLIKPQLIPVTDRQFERLVKFWLPAAEKSLVSRELFIDQIPDIDSEKELERLRGEASQQNRERLEALFGEDAVKRELSNAD